jgi:gamma-glutamyltranspeptidase/glutathione hydrolase
MATITALTMGHEVMISTEHYLSAAGGARIFARGGNAIDAAVAATLVESVVNPHMFTIGGEAPALIYSSKADRVVAVNGNMAAPRRATIAEYRSRGYNLVPLEGLLAAGVPAAFDSLITMLANFGTMAFADVVEPMLELCADGFPVHQGLIGHEAMQIRGMIAHQVDTESVNPHIGPISALADKFSRKWPSSGAVYMPDGAIPEVGRLIRNEALAQCIRRLLDAEAAARSRGRESALQAVRDRFYRGDIAREIAAWSERNDGLIAFEDLASFSARLERPTAANYRGYTVYKCPPWSQGPVFLQHLKLLEGWDLSALGHNSADYIHFLTETAKLAFADRELYYGDPEFVQVPLEGLLSSRYAEIRRALVDPHRASLEFRPGDPIRMAAEATFPLDLIPWGKGTVHVAAADRQGNMAAITASGAWIASSPLIDTLGFPLGSRMQTFYLDSRHPNALAPGKRPRTTLTPSLAARDGKPFLAFGTMGGDQQDQWTLQFFLNRIEFGMDVQEAIEAPKFSSKHFPSSFHPHDAFPGALLIEARIDKSVRDELVARGHRIAERPPWSEGFVVAVEIDQKRGILLGGADPRGHLADTFPARAIGW